MSIDGCSNINNNPVVCASNTKCNSDTILVDAIDTPGHSHTAKYLATIANNL